MTAPPDIIGFSYYLWNADLSLKIAGIIKQKYPDVVIVFGGPNFPVETHRQKKWLEENRQVDFFICLEGEKAFRNLVSAIIENNKDVEKIRRTNIENTCSYDGKTFFINPLGERLLNLDEIPSPYLRGYLDKYFFNFPVAYFRNNQGLSF